MVGESLDDIHRNAHMGGRVNVVEHYRDLRIVGQLSVIVLHLFGRQGIITRKRCHDDVGTQGSKSIHLGSLFADAVARQTGIDGHFAVCSFHGSFDQQSSLSLTYRITFACGAHQQWADIVLDKTVNDTTDSRSVNFAFGSDGSDHWDNYAAIFLLIHSKNYRFVYVEIVNFKLLFAICFVNLSQQKWHFCGAKIKFLSESTKFLGIFFKKKFSFLSLRYERNI